MLTEYFDSAYDLSASFVIGDRRNFFQQSQRVTGALLNFDQHGGQFQPHRHIVGKQRDVRFHQRPRFRPQSRLTQCLDQLLHKILIELSVGIEL